MEKLFHKATERVSLRNAWHRIRTNGSLSPASETRIAVDLFGRDVDQNIRKMQRQLRDNAFEFDPQKGVLKTKTSGGKRGIVMASVQNRVVERAWLDCLQSNCDFVKRVINQPTSVGGVPHRSVPHGLKMIRDAFSEGKLHYVRSDISGFFDNIPRRLVLKTIADEVDDQRFLHVLDAATTVVLANEATLGENRKVFPLDDQGVAQGSPLSPLFGNILLNDFDLRLNGRGIICIRFIDDFLLLGNSANSVERAFQSAKSLLGGLGLNCHDPFSSGAIAEKAGFGKAEKGFVFLGYDVRPGLFQPSRMARQKIEKQVDDHLEFGRWSIREVKRAGDSFECRQRYVQSLALIDKVLRGWGDAFAYGNSPNTIHEVDRRIDEKLDEFRNWFSAQIRNTDWKTRRRLGGVGLISDIPSKSLDDLPFSLERGRRFTRSANTVTISTDGSIISTNGRKGKEQGPGGWAYVVHETGVEKSGWVSCSTNNRMELQAVIEAIKSSDPKKSIIVRTDSRYVSDAVSGRTIVRTNGDLWRDYKHVSALRRVRVIWVKGHAGDRYNEMADRLAHLQAGLAKASLNRVAA